MKLLMIIHLLINVVAIVCNFWDRNKLKKAYHSPCMRYLFSYGNSDGYCVPRKECCSCTEPSDINSYNFELENGCKDSYWGYDGHNYGYHYENNINDYGNCTDNHYCCVHNYIICQSCLSGTRKVNDTCVDINECIETHGVCSGHKCINTEKSYECECYDSYEMIGEIKTCKHINESDTFDLLFSATRTINLLEINQYFNASNDIKMIYSGTQEPKSLDYSFGGNYIAWTDTRFDQINIAPMNEKHPSLVRDRITIRYLHNPDCIAIDWIHDLIYWVEFGTKTIKVIELHKPDEQYIVMNITDHEPNDLLVNVLERSLVWNHIGLKPRIMRSSQDGSNQTLLYQSFKQTFCLTIDIFLKRYYFIDIEDFSLNSINFEGKDEKTIIVSKKLINSINSMNVYHDIIFMSTNDLIFRMNKFGFYSENASGLIASIGYRNSSWIKSENIKQSFMKQIFDFKIVDPLLQPNIENKCSHKRCSHLCLPSDDNIIYRCLCPKNMILINNTLCSENKFKELVMSSMSWESDLQRLINYSNSKSIDLRKLLNKSYSEQSDLNKLFVKSFNEMIEMKKPFEFSSNQSLEMKRTFIQSVNETLIWRQLLNQTFYNKNDLEILFNHSIKTNNLTKLIDFVNNIPKPEQSANVMNESNGRTGEVVILSFIMIGIFVIGFMFVIISFKLNLIEFKKTSSQSLDLNKPLFRKSINTDSIEEMETKT